MRCRLCVDSVSNSVPEFDSDIPEGDTGLYGGGLCWRFVVDTTGNVQKEMGCTIFIFFIFFIFLIHYSRTGLTYGEAMGRALKA